jgi:hypothetical protein
VDLKLELSVPSFVDSVFYEMVGLNGQLIKGVGARRVNGPAFLYSQLVDSLMAGTSYFRARIQLKNGQTVYTGIIAVLSSGPRYLLLYPTPANRATGINFLYKQGTPAGTQIRIFDLYGRLVKIEDSGSGTINIEKFASGIYIYRLITPDQRTLETGKLIVR